MFQIGTEIVLENNKYFSIKTFSIVRKYIICFWFLLNALGSTLSRMTQKHSKKKKLKLLSITRHL